MHALIATRTQTRFLENCNHTYIFDKILVVGNMLKDIYYAKMKKEFKLTSGAPFARCATSNIKKIAFRKNSFLEKKFKI